MPTDLPDEAAAAQAQDGRPHRSLRRTVTRPLIMLCIGVMAVFAGTAALTLVVTADHGARISRDEQIIAGLRQYRGSISAEEKRLIGTRTGSDPNWKAGTANQLKLVVAAVDSQPSLPASDALRADIQSITNDAATWLATWTPPYPVPQIRPESTATKSALAQIDADIQHMLDDATADSSALAQSEQGAALLVVGSATVASVALAVGVFLTYRRLRGQIVRPLEGLASIIRGAAANDLSHRSNVGGPSEIQSIQSDLHTMMSALSETQARLIEMGLTDALTGLANRRSLDASLVSECERAVRYARPLCFAMLDVDHFKLYNDTHGHAAGDELLRRLPDVLRKTVRSTDRCYRYGGEEFAIVLTETTLMEAAPVLERIRDEVHREIGITISIGVARCDQRISTADSLTQAADAALYQAKREGRDRVVLAPAY